MAKRGGVENEIQAKELKERVEEATLHYNKHAKGLETDHYGEFVAITHDGRIIIGKDDIEVLKKFLPPNSQTLKLSIHAQTCAQLSFP